MLGPQEDRGILANVNTYGACGAHSQKNYKISDHFLKWIWIFQCVSDDVAAKDPMVVKPTEATTADQWYSDRSHFCLTLPRLSPFQYF